jgi:hypothetical protein
MHLYTTGWHVETETGFWQLLSLSSGSTTEKFLFDSRQGQAIFLKSIQIGTIIPIQGTSKFIFPGVKRPRREANQLSTAEVKNQ